MAGTSNVRGDESVTFTDNMSFDGTDRGGKMTADGQLWIGATASNRANNGGHVRLGTLTPGTGISITNGPGTIAISVSGSAVGQTITGDTGGPLSPTAGNWNIISTATNGIETTGSGSTLTVAMLTPYADGDFEFRSAVSGATRTLSVTNTSNTASSQATQLVSVAGGTAGDAWTQYSIGTTNSYSLGIDNSASDILKITTTNSGTINPSSGTHAAGFTTAGGVELGPNASATTDANTFVVMEKDQNGVSQVGLLNSTNGTASVAKLFVSVGGTTSGSLRAMSAAFSDATLADRFSINSDSSAIGFDITRDDVTANLRFTSTTTVHGNVTSAGEWTFPLQPAFLAVSDTTVNNITGNGTIYTPANNSEIYDQNADYNNATFTFTAPVTGRYYFSGYAFFVDLAVTHTDIDCRFVTSNRTYALINPNQAFIGNRSWGISTYCDMDAADTCLFRVIVSGSTLTVDIAGTNTTGGLILTSFSGQLEV